MISVETARNAMATAFGDAYDYVATCTGAPGTSTTLANESTGGTPTYARKQTTWGTAASSAIVGSAVVIDSPAATISYVAICGDLAGNTHACDVDITDAVLSGQGTVTVTPTMTFS